jgi:S-(hydroxymethyl)glutathione dehydrogenase/alcohol dehydrogenase
MRAVVLTAPHTRPTVLEIAPRALGPSDVQVRITASGVCHSDLLPIQGHSTPHGWPLVLGHGGAGVVEALGEAVSNLRPGDRVVAFPVASCGRCYWCVRGESNLCASFIRKPQSLTQPQSSLTDGTSLYSTSGLGTFADVLVAAADAFIGVTTDLPDDQIALLGCGVTTGVCAALNAAKVEPGSTVAIIGLGAVGQSVAQGSRIAGATRIIGIDPVAMKRRSASEGAVTHAVDPAVDDPVQCVIDLTGGRGADYTFEVAGRADTAMQAYRALRRDGTMTLVGAQPPDATLPWSAYDQMVNGKKVIGTPLGSANARRDLPRLIAFVENGQLDIESLISRRITIDQVADALDALEQGETIRSVMITTDLSAAHQSSPTSQP